METETTPLSAQKACEDLLKKYETNILGRYFKAQFTTKMVPMIYIKFSGAKADAPASELAAAKHQVQYMIYGFNADGTQKEKVTASPSTVDNKLPNISGSLEHVMSEICKVLDKYI
jgi:hypothetical protein